MENNKMFSQWEIYSIIDEEIKREMEAKNKYVQLNGYSHRDTLQAFDHHIAALSALYGRFNENGAW
jgi:ferritin